MVALDPRVVEELRMRHHLPSNVINGILVFRMVQDSPADKAGIRWESDYVVIRCK